MLFAKAGRASCNGSAPNYQERILELALIICAEEVRDGDAEAAEEVRDGGAEEVRDARVSAADQGGACRVSAAEAVHGACALAEGRDGARHAWVAAEDGGSRRGLPL